MSDVGYGKPPAAHRFKPGTSGNPRGRPKGARGFKSDLADALGATITVKENGNPRRISVGAAALKRLIQKAVVEGNLRAIERLLVLAQQSDVARAAPAATLSLHDQAVIDDFLKRASLRGSDDE